MGDRDDFLAQVLERHLPAMDAFHRGETGPWTRYWADEEPVTLFAPGRTPALGREEVVATFSGAASRLSQGTDGRVDVLHVEVDGDVGVVAGVERSAFSVDGGPVQAQALRVTLVYRREDGEWRLVHRHADGLPG